MVPGAGGGERECLMGTEFRLKRRVALEVAERTTQQCECIAISELHTRTALTACPGSVLDSTPWRSARLRSLVKTWPSQREACEGNERFHCFSVDSQTY